MKKISSEILKFAKSILSHTMRWGWHSDETTWQLTWKPGWNYVLYDHESHPDIGPEPTKRLTFKDASGVWHRSKYENFRSDDDAPPWLMGEELEPAVKPAAQKKMVTVDEDMSRSLYGMTQRGGEWRSDKQRDFFSKIISRGQSLSTEEKRYAENADYGVMIGPAFQKGALSGVPIYYVDEQGVRLHVIRWQAANRYGVKKKWER
jgi:hypothetical protein